MRRFPFAIGLLGLGLLLPASPAHAADSWEFEVIPYLWAAEISLDAEVNDRTVGGDLSFNDLLDKTDLAFAFHFEAGRGKGGFLFDFFGIKGSDEMNLTGTPIPILDQVRLETEVDALVLEGGGYFRPGGSDGSFDLIFGIRYIDLDQTLKFSLALPPLPPLPPEASFSQGVSTSFTDGFIGARYKKLFADKWAFAARGDVGGGDTEQSWSAMASFGYSFGQSGKYSLRFGWKHFSVEVEEEQGPVTIEADISFSGPIVGFVIRFQ